MARLPPELEDLLERLRRRGIPVSSLELARLAHLLTIQGTFASAELPVLLASVLCKTEHHRRLLEREYKRWASDHEREPAPGSGSGEETAARTGTGKPTQLAAELGAAGTQSDIATAMRLRLNWHALVSNRRFYLALAGAVLIAVVWMLRPVSVVEKRAPPIPTAVSESAAPPPEGAICPQDLPVEAVSEVWTWGAKTDERPWYALWGGALLLLSTVTTGWRLLRAQHRYLHGMGAEAGGDRTPRQGLEPKTNHADLLLDPGQRREMVWSIDRYVSEDPTRELDTTATVDATARAGGEPHIIQRHLSFPREVWLWCDKKTTKPELQECLVAEVRKALSQANLPVRVAHFHGLPAQLRWEESREPFAPAFADAAGHRAVVAVISDGTALLRAWNNPGERSALENLLRQLRTWPRLCLVDLGVRSELIRLAPEWRIPVCRGDELAAWLAGRLNDLRARPVPDAAQIDLWAAACLLVDPAPDHVAAQTLRCDMELRLDPLDYPHLLARLDTCADDPELADRLVTRLAGSQTLDERGLPKGDGFFTRALAYWESRFEETLKTLATDDIVSRGRLRIGLAKLQLWRDPKSAAATLKDLAGDRNQKVVAEVLGGISTDEGPASSDLGVPHGRRVTWKWEDLSRQVQYRLLSLGLGRVSEEAWKLRLGARHHLAFALLLGTALSGIAWGSYRLVAPDRSMDPVYRDPQFAERTVQVEQGVSAWLGSPWAMTQLTALGPLSAPYVWSWQSVPNPQKLDEDAAIYVSGTQAFPIRGCGKEWPRRSLGVIQADRDDEDARRLAIRLLDRGAADRVLIAENWQAHLDALDQGLNQSTADRIDPSELPADEQDQLLLFLPNDAPQVSAELAERHARMAVIRGEFGTLAQTLDFSGERAIPDAWPQARTRILAGSPTVLGGPEYQTVGGLTWVRVCGGTFLMGSPDSEDQYIDEYARQYVDSFGGSLEDRRKDVAGWLDRERPRHRVLVDDFWITRTELSGSQYGLPGSSAGGESRLPATRVSWKEAAAVCEGKGLPLPETGFDSEELGSLPSEAQWEYAARAGTHTRWSFRESDTTIADFAWFRKNSDWKAQPVGTRQPNGLCLADMHGNVWEWVQDCFDAGLYGTRSDELSVDPLEGPDNPESCDWRVVRGGSFVNPPAYLRSANRAADRSDVRNENQGLRCVRSRARQH